MWSASNYLAAIVQVAVRLKKLELNPSKNPTGEQNVSYSFESETTIGSTSDGLFTLAAEMPIEFFGVSYPRPFRGKEYLANY
jgi:hypothetical protein